MTVDHRLSWVQSNRKRAEHATPIGELVAKMAASMPARGDAEEAAAVIADLVDDEFRKHCRVAGQRNGPWVVNVDAPALVYPMRLRWSARLREALRQLDAEGPSDPATAQQAREAKEKELGHKLGGRKPNPVAHRKRSCFCNSGDSQSGAFNV